MNPLIPTPLDTVWTLLAIAHAVCAVLALLALWNARDRVRHWSQRTWALLGILLFPIVGSIAVLMMLRAQKRYTVSAGPQ